VPPRNFLRDSLGVLLMVRAVVAARLLGPLPYGAHGTTLPIHARQGRP